MGSVRLEKPSETTESNCSPGTAKCPQVPHPQVARAGAVTPLLNPVLPPHLSPAAAASLIPGIVLQMDQACHPP